MEQQFNQTSAEPSGSRSASQNTQDVEGEIRAVVEGIQEAFRAKDLDKLMSYYAKDVVAYDMVPPLSFKGVEAYRNSWQKALDMMTDVGPLETAEDRYHVSGDLAVLHNLCHMEGTLKKNNEKIDSWSRYTGVFKKMNGKWLVVHEQFSVPIDMESEKAVWNLKPEGQEVMQ